MLATSPVPQSEKVVMLSTDGEEGEKMIGSEMLHWSYN